MNFETYGHLGRLPYHIRDQIWFEASKAPTFDTFPGQYLPVPRTNAELYDEVSYALFRGARLAFEGCTTGSPTFIPESLVRLIYDYGAYRRWSGGAEAPK
ncbi:hypothetical protein ASPCAL03665 [Aspergillus calidoustus]|uniref:Uncharacterized protein n=1 Tax=Aspergillus calidoustus TaxID=454130 RepID=A0A0U5FSM0_ASPCI|nr:hypothetical protein ASPCAL03665 [Aspergillus calidoustus]